MHGQTHMEQALNDCCVNEDFIGESKSSSKHPEGNQDISSGQGSQDTNSSFGQ